MREKEGYCIQMHNDVGSLNFAMYVGCAFGLIPQRAATKQSELWPYKSFCRTVDNQNLAVVSGQWNQWWLQLVEHRSQQVLEHAPTIISKWYEPPGFSSLNMPELQTLCEKAWPHFHEWWNMPAGGRMALGWYCTQSGGLINKCVRAFEENNGREPKPFQLHIDLVYTGISEIIEVTPEHVVLFTSHLLLDKNWWMDRLQQIG